METWHIWANGRYIGRWTGERAELIAAMFKIGRCVTFYEIGHAAEVW